jgi:hypothetical protein
LASTADAPPLPGQVVHVRSRQYLVEGVVGPPQLDDQTLARLACLDDYAQDVALEVLWEKEVDFRKRGRAVAALIPIRHLKLPERLEDEVDVREARKALKEGGLIPWKKVKKDLGLSSDGMVGSFALASISLRIRVGDYRIFYLVKDDVLLVVVIRIGNRREMYR